MPLRYRRTVRLVPGLRLNFARQGASLSGGSRGFTRNFSRRGVRTTVSAPGTGVSFNWMSGSRRNRRRGSVVGGLALLVVAIAAARVLFGG